MELWLIALIISWPLSGLVTWLWAVWHSRELTVGDVLVIPMMMILGWLTLLLFFIAAIISNQTKVLWRRRK